MMLYKYLICILLVCIGFIFQIFPHYFSIGFFQTIKIYLTLALMTYFSLFLNKNFIFVLCFVIGFFSSLMEDSFFFGFHQISYLIIFYTNQKIKSKISNFTFLLYGVFFLINYSVLSLVAFLILNFRLEQFEIFKYMQISFIEVFYCLFLLPIIYFSLTVFRKKISIV